MFSIKNEFLQANFKVKGAELCGISDQKRQYIWQADPAIWARHAPILFPIVGKLENNEYTHQGKSYQMSQHGFARDLDFEMFLHEDTKIAFRLTESSKTTKIYPFNFVLEVFYELRDQRLIVSYKVTNPDSQILYFSVGAHPAFICPLDDKNREDYRLVFDKSETAERHLLENGTYSGETELAFENGILPIRKDLFAKDALVFKNLASQKVILADPDFDILSLRFKNFPYLGIWSKDSESKFVCIEPWFGLSDSKNKGGEISEKEGIIALAAGQVFECEYEIEIY